MKLMLLVVVVATVTTVTSIPVNSITEDIMNYTTERSYSDEFTQEPRLNLKKENDLKSSELRYPFFIIGYPAFGGYHGYHGYHGYFGPHWHHWHGYGWGPHRAHCCGHKGYHGGGIGNIRPWVY